MSFPSEICGGILVEIELSAFWPLNLVSSEDDFFCVFVKTRSC